MDVASLRSLLFVPGDSPRKLARALEVPADALIIDWEDAVADHKKEFARTSTLEVLPRLLAYKTAVFVRLNVGNKEFMDADCRALRECAADGVVVPKCETTRDVEDLLGALPGAFAIVPLIESPPGLLHAARIADCSSRVAALMFGAEDYTAEAQILRSTGEPEVLFARSSIVNAARAMHREVFDSPLMQYRDLAAVRQAAERGRRLGFTGQAAIHPAQVDVINEVFLPTDEEIEAAQSILRRYKHNRGGVYGVEGSLEDHPTVRHARQLIAKRERILGGCGPRRSRRHLRSPRGWRSQADGRES